MTQRIPVAPASHYVMGGIVTDLDGLRRASACTPSASAPAPACTAPTGSRRTRSASASSSAAGRRLKGLDDPPPGEPSAYPGEPVERAEPRDPRGRLAARGAGAQRGRPRRAQPRPAPARAAGRDQRQGARGDPRLARARGIPRARPGARPPAHDPRPRQRDAALRDVALERAADRLGRRADDEHARLLRRLPGARGAGRAPRVPGRSRARWRDLECGRIDLATFERRLAAALGVARRGPRAPPDRRTSARTRRCATRSRQFHAQGIRTALVSNSWRARGLRRRRSLRRDRALGRARHPQARPGDLRRRRRARSASLPSAASSSTTSAGTSSPRKPWV